MSKFPEVCYRWVKKGDTREFQVWDSSLKRWLVKALKRVKKTTRLQEKMERETIENRVLLNL